MYRRVPLPEEQEINYLISVLKIWGIARTRDDDQSCAGLFEAIGVADAIHSLPKVCLAGEAVTLDAVVASQGICSRAYA